MSTKEHKIIFGSKLFPQKPEDNFYYKLNKQYFLDLVNLINEYPHAYCSKLLAKGKKSRPNFIPKYKYLGEWVTSVTSFALSDSIFNMATKCYWIIAGITDFPHCVVCTKQDNYKTRNVHFWTGYHENCSPECIQNNDITKQHRVQTCNEKYGCDNTFQFEPFKEKSKQTKLNKYGNENFKNPKKAKQTRLQHMCEDPLFQFKITLKSQQTQLKLYGVTNVMKSPEFNRKIHKRYLFNGLSFSSSAEIAVYVWLKEHNINFEYQPNESYPYESNGVIHQYFPDFKLLDENKYIEIKGCQFFKNPNYKMSIPWRKKNQTDEQYKKRCEQESAKYELIVSLNVKIILDPSDELSKMKLLCEQKFGGKLWYKQFQVDHKCK